MSLPRKDVRAYIDAELYQALLEICEHDGISTAEFVEALVVPAIEKRVHDAITLADRFRRRGISRQTP